MLTFSLFDIDSDEYGEPRAHFLIKRAVGWGGDRFVSERGNFNILFSGETRWTNERDFNKGRNFNHNVSRLMPQSDYPALEAAGRVMAYRELTLSPPQSLVDLSQAVNTMQYPDQIAFDRARLEVLRSAQPFNERYGLLLSRSVQGWYIPDGRTFALGDNRDNSRDGRYFGPIQESRVLGKAFVIYWPILDGRIGFIR
jgi:signal peptidase I